MRFVNKHPVWSGVIVLAFLLAIVLVTQFNMVVDGGVGGPNPPS